MTEFRELTVRTKTFTGHIPRTEIVRTAREDPNIADGHVAIERRCEGRKDRSVGGSQGVRVTGPRSRGVGNEGVRESDRGGYVGAKSGSYCEEADDAP